MNRKVIQVDVEAHRTLLECSQKTGHTIKDLVSLLIVTNINFLKSPVEIAKKFSMIKDGN